MPLETQFPHLLKGTGYASWPDLPKCPNGVQLKFNKQTGTSRQQGKPVSVTRQRPARQAQVLPLSRDEDSEK